AGHSSARITALKYHTPHFGDKWGTKPVNAKLCVDGHYPAAAARADELPGGTRTVAPALQFPATRGNAGRTSWPPWPDCRSGPETSGAQLPGAGTPGWWSPADTHAGAASSPPLPGLAEAAARAASRRWSAESPHS